MQDRGHDTVVVAGGGGFIGGHLAAALRPSSRAVRVVDIKPPGEAFQLFDDIEYLQLDLRDKAACERACRGASAVYQLAAEMGGMGFIEANKAACMLNVQINVNMLLAARDADVESYFYTSSACVYNLARQDRVDAVPLRESDAYPALPEDGYGWEKLFSERLCRHFREDYGLETSMARLHNTYGPYGAWHGGREKAPSAICRKVIEAKLGGHREIEIWGDGRQTRSFTYVDDVVDGIGRIVSAGLVEPINLGSEELVSINQLVDLVEAIAGTRLERRYRLDAPKGVTGRNSDNTRIRELLDWAPSTKLADGLEATYRWIHDEYVASIEGRGVSPERSRRRSAG